MTENSYRFNLTTLDSHPETQVKPFNVNDLFLPPPHRLPNPHTQPVTNMSDAPPPAPDVPESADPGVPTLPEKNVGGLPDETAAIPRQVTIPDYFAPEKAPKVTGSIIPAIDYAATGTSMLALGNLANSQLRKFQENKLGSFGQLNAAQTNFQDTLDWALAPARAEATLRMQALAQKVGRTQPQNWHLWDGERLTPSQDEVHSRWSALDRAGHTGPQVDPDYIEALKTNVESPAARSALSLAAEDMNKAYSNHMTELTAARNGLKMSRLANIGALAGGELANVAIDRAFFSDVDRSWRTIGLDVAAPAVILSRAPWPVKLGAIVGAHIAARTWDYLDSQPRSAD